MTICDYSFPECTSKLIAVVWTNVHRLVDHALQSRIKGNSLLKRIVGLWDLYFYHQVTGLEDIFNHFLSFMILFLLFWLYGISCLGLTWTFSCAASNGHIFVDFFDIFLSHFQLTKYSWAVYIQLIGMELF